MRQVKEVTVTLDNRDKGKVFVLTEMPPMQAEKWATRALLALGRSGATIPDEILQAGMAGLANIGLRALFGLKWEDAEPLLDEMMGCVQIKMPSGVVRTPTFDGDIEEVATLLMLRSEIITLHTGFSFADAVSTLKASAPATSTTQSAPTSQEPSLQ